MANAIEMLREDHRKVQELFKQFEEAGDGNSKKQIAGTALAELKVHAALEEEIFYPAVREEIDDEQTVDEALEEHHVAKLLISELGKMGPGDDRFDAKFTVLAEMVKHHIEEEESEVLPEVEGSLDSNGLGVQMEERKQELQQRKRNGASPGKRKKRPNRGRAGGRKKKSRTARAGRR